MMSEILRVPWGNDFRVHICYKNCVPAEEEGVSFADIEDLSVELVRFPDQRIPASYTLTDEGDIVVDVKKTVTVKTLYSVEASGTYQGHPWRWKSRPLFRLVDANKCGNVGGMETFGEDIYYVDDTFSAEVDGETMTIYTHGLAGITSESDGEGGSIGTFTLRSGGNVEIDTQKESVNIREYGNQSNCNQGQAWQCNRI